MLQTATHEEKTLVLSASYQPLTVVDSRRGVTMLLDGTAELVEGTGRLFRSPTRAIPEPSVVRLEKHFFTPFRCRLPMTRRAVLARDGWQCGYCTNTASTVDHIIPRSRGGAHTWDNVIAACPACNRRKAARTPAEAGMPLRREPFEPRAGTAARIALNGFRPAWEVWFTGAGAPRTDPMSYISA